MIMIFLISEVIWEKYVGVSQLLGAILGLFLFLFFTVESKQMFHIKLCQRRESNGGPLGSETTTLPTEPLPLPIVSKSC